MFSVLINRVSGAGAALILAFAGISGLSAPAAASTRSQAVAVVQTDLPHGQALAARPPLTLRAQAAPRQIPVVRVSAAGRYQTFVGVGAAMTDSSAWLLWDVLPAAARHAAMQQLFGPGGLRLSFLRVPMGASDYTVSEAPYTYDDLPPGESDPDLSSFSIGHDEAYILPALRDAVALNPRLYLEAVPWTAPAWMKANGQFGNWAHGGRLLPQARGAWAEYFVRFLQAYAADGVPVQAISPQNEPGVWTAYPGLQLDQAGEVDFVANYLQPALAAAGLHPSIFGWDLSWGPLRGRDPVVAATRRALAGLAWHCYFGSPYVMSLAQSANPAMEQIVDECSPGAAGTMATSEAMIASFRNGATAFATWNLALDPRGEPVEPPNSGCPHCTGLLTVDASAGTVRPTPALFVLGQLSRYVEPGATRIDSPHFVRYRLNGSYQTQVSPGLDDVAFVNPDGTKVLVTHDSSARPIRFALEWQNRYGSYTIPPRATTTFVWR